MLTTKYIAWYRSDVPGTLPAGWLWLTTQGSRVPFVNETSHINGIAGFDLLVDDAHLVVQCASHAECRAWLADLNAQLLNSHQTTVRLSDAPPPLPDTQLPKVGPASLHGPTKAVAPSAAPSAASTSPRFRQRSVLGGGLSGMGRSLAASSCPLSACLPSAAAVAAARNVIELGPFALGTSRDSGVGSTPAAAVPPALGAALPSSSDDENAALASQVSELRDECETLRTSLQQQLSTPTTAVPPSLLPSPGSCDGRPPTTPSLPPSPPLSPLKPPPIWKEGTSAAPRVLRSPLFASRESAPQLTTPAPHEGHVAGGRDQNSSASTEGKTELIIRMTEDRSSSATLFSLHAKYEGDVRSGEPVSKAQLWFLCHEDSACWLQPAVDFADGHPIALYPSKQSAKLQLSVDKSRNDYGALSVVAIPSALSERILFVKQCHHILRTFVSQFDDSDTDGAQGGDATAAAIEARASRAIQFAPSRLSIRRLIALLRSAKAEGTADFRLAQELIVEHRLPAIIVQCTRIPFDSGRYEKLQSVAPTLTPDSGRPTGGADDEPRLVGEVQGAHVDYGLLPGHERNKVRRAETYGGELHGFLTECYLLLKDAVLGNMQNKLYISQYIVGDYWPNFSSHFWHGLGAARLLTEIFSDNVHLQDNVEDETIMDLLEPIKDEDKRTGRSLDFLIALCVSEGRVHRRNQRRLTEMLFADRVKLRPEWKPSEWLFDLWLDNKPPSPSRRTSWTGDLYQ